MPFITLMLGNIRTLAMSAYGLIGLYLFKRNKDLKAEKLETEEDLKQANKTIDIQKKVIDVAANTKPTDFDGNLERMRKDQL